MTLSLQDIATTPQQLKTIILDVRKYAHWFTQNAVKMQVSKTSSGGPPAISQPAVTVINNWFNKTSISQKGLDELLVTLQDLEARAPRITITLAAAAPTSLKKVLTDWCRTNIDPNLLVDFHFNATLLGGMVIRHGSHVYDWSFRRQIMASRERFPEVLRRV